MDESILTSIKKLLGIEEDYINFDTDIILYINSVFVTLKQLGAGPIDGYSISDKTAKWSDYLGTDSKLNDIQTYMYMKVRLVFDPPSTSFGIDSLRKMITEAEWRIQVERDI